MGKQVVILVDGQNLYYSLQGMKIIEKDVDWTSLFGSMIDEGDELIRTYWFRPSKILDTYYTEQNIQNFIVFDDKFHIKDRRKISMEIDRDSISHVIEKIQNEQNETDDKKFLNDVFLWRL